MGGGGSSGGWIGWPYGGSYFITLSDLPIMDLAELAKWRHSGRAKRVDLPHSPRKALLRNQTWS